jgi:hypothetical protein
MAEKTEVLNALHQLQVPHLVSAFLRATNPKGGHRTWIDVEEIKDIVRVAATQGPTGIGAVEWKAILVIAKYKEVGSKAQAYLKDLQHRWNNAAAVRLQGFVVPLSEAAKYEDKYLGEGKLKGQCATGVQMVFGLAGKSLGLTSTWKEGVRVKGNNIAAGTAIASFRKGRYANDHAAIFIRETGLGLEVWDQWVSKPWRKRTLYFDYKGGAPYSNDGDLFSVIIK